MWQSSPGLPRPFAVMDDTGNVAIYGHETGINGTAVYAETNANQTTAVFATAQGDYADAIIAHASGLSNVGIHVTATGTDSFALKVLGAIAVDQADVHVLGSYAGVALPIYDAHTDALLGYVPLYNVTS